MSDEQISAFFSDSLKDMRSPFDLKDMTRAVDRIARAVAAQEKILIFGDYDADGITATVLLYQFLKEAGAAVSTYIPHRIHEGYSLQKAHIEDQTISGGIDLKR